MPFDTTYNINTLDENLSGTVTFPGGEDLIITLNPGQLPSMFDSALAHHDSAVTETRIMLQKDLKKENHWSPDFEFVFIFLAIFGFIIYRFWKRSEVNETYSQTIFTNKINKGKKNLLTYYGDELYFTDEQIAAMLIKRFPYYKSLSQEEQCIFVKRVQKFMADKTFKIHDEKGFKEMPVLVSAAAIQLTFGLKKYLLPHFRFIHIHPQEFLRVQPILCFLEGNVSGHSINLSWKHFLDGYANPKDGQNVGLHELAHALYYQTFEVEENIDRNFRSCYDDFNTFGNKAYNTEKTVAGGLYSEYAEKNFQEFWAESVEIFFEKPVEMRSHYPQLYQAMKEMLNQDPVLKAHLMGS
jgi:Mlc titration factor MtfA (ptsG expression regulator)